MEFSRLIAAGFLLLTSCSSGYAQPEFFVDLTLRSEENSEDSNSTTETLRIEGNKAQYSWSYDGYMPGENFETEDSSSWNFTDEQIQGLQEFVRRENLDADVMEEKEMGGDGHSVEMQLEVHMDGQKSTMTIQGMSDYFFEEHAGELIENMDYVEAAQELMYIVKDMGGSED